MYLCKVCAKHTMFTVGDVHTKYASPVRTSTTYLR